MRSTSPSVYCVDDEGSILSANEQFFSFAKENGWDVKERDLIGSSLWSHIHDPLLTDIYRHLMAAVKSRKEPVSFAFRCNSPRKERHMTMVIHRNDNGVVFACELDFELDWLFVAPDPRLGPLRHVCMDCASFHFDDTKQPILTGLTQGLVVLGHDNLQRRACSECMDGQPAIQLEPGTQRSSKIKQGK